MTNGDEPPMTEEFVERWFRILADGPGRLCVPFRCGYGPPHEPHDALVELARRGRVRKVAATDHHATWELA